MESNEWKTGQITINFDGIPLHLKLTVPAFPVKPGVMLPLLQQLANSLTDLAVQKAERAQATISCRKGCGACCRQAVPIAEIEIYHIRDIVNSLPEPRRSEIQRRFAAATNYLQDKGWFDRLENCTDPDEMKRIVHDYFVEGIPCPFLEEESCSIHNDRPIACREFLVTSPAENCSRPDEGFVAQLPLPVNASDGLRKLGRTPHAGKQNFIPLVRALAWAQAYPESFEMKTGEEWLSDFFS